uniref:Uncharacterized protein n=1 Tax=Acrobeloides nanus TaxID=290746 RepID=A0A914E7H8_9BILA
MTDSWDQNYREIVREYGPPLDRPSLFIFGRDEYIRSESRGNEELKDSAFNPEYERPKSIADKPPISPPPPPPLPPGWSRPKIKEPIAV